MKFLLVGLGSIGQRHLANLVRIVPGAEVAVWRHDRHAAAPAGCRAVYSLEDALAFGPGAALITGPASEHIRAALPLARAGVPLMIEKPLSHDLEGVDELLSESRRTGAPLMVAYNFRFCEPLAVLRRNLQAGRIGRAVGLTAETGQYLPDWRPGRDYRQAVSAQRRLGGGVILELSHELDIARWLLGDVRSVLASAYRLGDLDVDVEDSADIVLKFDHAMANIHLDMIRRVPCRRCTVLGTDGQLEWNGLTNEVQAFQASSGRREVLVPPNGWDRNHMYEAELKHFIDCVRDGSAPIVDGEEGRQTLAVALAARRSSEEHREVAL